MRLKCPFHRERVLRVNQIYLPFHMWSKITIAAVVLMLAAGVFFYQNNESLKKEKAARDQATAELNTTNGYISDEEQKLADATQKRNTYKADSETLGQELAVLKDANGKLQADLAIKENDLKETTDKLDELNKKFDGKDLSEIAAEIDAIKKENTRVSSEIAAKTAQHEALTKHSEQLVNAADGLTKLAADQRARISPANLKTSVRSIYDTWGFIILSGGANEGVVLGSKLAVMRGNDKIAELNVSTVEPTMSSAEVIPSTMTEGEKIMVGDKVVSVRPE